MKIAKTGLFILEAAEIALTLLFVALAMLSLSRLLADNDVNPVGVLLAGYTLMGVLVARLWVRAFLFGRKR